MNLNFIRTYIMVVDEGNFSLAAQRLHLSQPAVSMQMKALARELGVELLARRGHRVEPTEAGTLLYEQGRTLLQGWQQTLYQLGGLTQRLKGRLHLGASTMPGDFLLPPRLCEFYRLHPELNVQMVVAPSTEILEALLSAHLDLAVVGMQPQSSSLASQVIFKDRLGVVCSPQHPLAKRKSVTVEQLQAQPLLQRTRGSATRQVLAEALGQSPGLKVAMELGSHRAQLEAAARGLGVAVVSQRAAADYIELGRLIWLPVSDLDLERDFWLVWPKSQMSPAAQAFSEYLQRGDFLD